MMMLSMSSMTLADVCVKCVVMMVMGKCDYDKVCWEHFLGKNMQVFSGIGDVSPDGVSRDGVCPLCLPSCWCLGGLSMLASWWLLGGASVNLDGVRWCCGPCSCFRGVSVVSFPWYRRDMKKHFFWQKWRTYQYQLGVHRDAERGYWGCMPA